MKSLIVLVLSDCPACHEFMPRFGRLAAPYRAAGMPISIFDLEGHSQAEMLAQRLKVNATPTVVAIGKKGARIVAVGAVDDGAIQKILRDAAKKSS